MKLQEEQEQEQEQESEEDESELGDEVPQIAVGRLPDPQKKHSENCPPLPSIHKQRSRSIRQSKEAFYDPNYDIEKDEEVQSQITSLQDELSQKNDDVISVGNTSLSTMHVDRSI